MLSITKAGGVAGIIAATTFISTPASAAELPAAPAVPVTASYAQFDHSIYDGQSEIAEWRRWGRRGYRRNRVRAGDILTGVLIIGGIAAIANSANRNNRRDRDVEVRRERDTRNNTRDNRRSTGSTGLDSAVNQCVDRIERDVRIESVDGVDRTANGWMVTGVIFDGRPFSCQIDNNGRIAGVDYGGYQGSSYDGANTTRARGEDLQWSDDRYAEARARAGEQTRVVTTSDPQPAYPGGPLPGEDFPEDTDADLGG